eukprot:9506541-Ditylum_brightwellii.AAC.1
MGAVTLLQGLCQSSDTKFPMHRSQLAPFGSYRASDIDEEGILLYLIKDDQSASRAKTDRWGLVSFVLVPVGHYRVAFILENTPVE